MGNEDTDCQAREDGQRDVEIKALILRTTTVPEHGPKRQQGGGRNHHQGDLVAAQQQVERGKVQAELLPEKEDLRFLVELDQQLRSLTCVCSSTGR